MAFCITAAQSMRHDISMMLSHLKSCISVQLVFLPYVEQIFVIIFICIAGCVRKS